MAHEISDPQSVVLNNPFREKSMILKDFDSFLDAVIKPVHEIVAAVRFRNLVRGTRFIKPEYVMPSILLGLEHKHMVLQGIRCLYYSYICNVVVITAFLVLVVTATFVSSCIDLRFFLKLLSKGH